MPNKHTVKGKYNEVVGKVTDDKARELKGMAEGKYGKLKDKAHDLPEMDMDMDMSEESMFSIVVGVLLILSGLYFVMRAKDDLF